MLDGTEFFECVCGSSEHTLRIILDKSEHAKEWPPEIFTELYLQQRRNIFKRFWIAIKYVFNYKCKYGHWDVFSLQIEDAKRLRGMIDEFIRCYDEYNRNQDSKKRENNSSK